MLLKKPVRILFFSALLLLPISAQSASAISLSGKVTGPTGAPISNAKVALLGQSITVVTNSNGEYTFSGVSVLDANRAGNNMTAKVILKEGALFFNIPKKNTPVKVTLFNTSGQKIRSFTSIQNPCSNFEVPLFNPNTPSQTYVVELQIGDNYSVYKIPFVGNSTTDISLTRSTSTHAPAFFSSLPPLWVDTIKVTFNGCIDKLVPVHNYISTVNISLSNQFSDTGLTYVKYVPKSTDRVISRSDYINRLHGFWLGECIANWTGLITELDKVGMPRTGPFYTDLNWKGPDLKSMWGSGPAPIIDFVFTSGTEPWGSDDDTDMEYLYQYLLEQHKTSTLTGEQIRDGWLKHIYDNKQQTPFGTDDDPSGGYQNFLWVSNQQAFDLMRDDQMIPPATSDPVNNQSYDMIDAQLTTEIFGFFAPSRPDVALKMAYLPIRTTANCNAELISKFYVTMYSLTSYVNNVDSLKNLPIKEKIFWMADLAASKMPDSSYASKMYKFVRAKYNAHPDSADWEATRDSVYYRYQGAKNSVQKADGYVFSGHGDSMSNSGGFDAGINFASSLVSLFYGQGDLPRTIKIGTLCGWDSDNPTATWGGLLGFMLGKDGIEKAFNKTNFSDTYLISRTRKIFPDRNGSLKGEDSFQMMSQRGVFIIDRVVQNEMKGGVNLAEDVWYVPDNGGL